MKKISLSRQIYHSDRIEITSYLMDPCMIAGDTRMISKGYCALSLGIPKREFNQNTKGLNFNIPPELFKKFMNTLEMVIHWFYDPGKKDLFCLDEQNIPHFNMDYQNLKYSVKNKRNSNRVEFVPSEVDANGTVVEGVTISINFLDNLTQVPLSELEELFSLLSNFSYQSEICLLTQMYTMGIITKRILTSEEYSMHSRFESYGNINTPNNPFAR